MLVNFDATRLMVQCSLSYNTVSVNLLVVMRMVLLIIKLYVSTTELGTVHCSLRSFEFNYWYFRFKIHDERKIISPRKYQSHLSKIINFVNLRVSISEILSKISATKSTLMRAVNRLARTILL